MSSENAVVVRLLQTLPSAASATFLALFPIVNPFGGVPIFFTLTSFYDARERNKTAMRTAAYVIGILVSFSSSAVSCSISSASRCRC